MTHTEETRLPRNRFRIRFAKIGLLRWIGHRDLQRLWERMFRRAGVRLSMSEGFHPKPRISFPSALALGVEGLDEVVEVDLADSIDEQTVLEKLVGDEQPGLVINEVRLIGRGQPSGPGVELFPGFVRAKLHSSVYEILLPESSLVAPEPGDGLSGDGLPGAGLSEGAEDECRLCVEAIDRAITNAKAGRFLMVVRKDKTVVAEIDRDLPVFERRGDTIHLVQIDSDAATLKPTDILDAAGLGDLIEAGAVIRRTRVVLVDEADGRPSDRHAIHDESPTAIYQNI